MMHTAASLLGPNMHSASVIQIVMISSPERGYAMPDENAFGDCGVITFRPMGASVVACQPL